MKVFVLVLSALLVLAASSANAQLTAPLEGREGVGSPGAPDLPSSPSPALESCLSSGGTIASFTSAEGTLSMCKIGEALIGDWTLHYELNNDDQYAAEVFLKHPTPSKWRGANPASEYCADLGGMSVVVESSLGQMGVCQFADRSQIEEWTLFRGPQDPENADLARVLTK